MLTANRANRFHFASSARSLGFCWQAGRLPQLLCTCSRAKVEERGGCWRRWGGGGGAEVRGQSLRAASRPTRDADIRPCVEIRRVGAYLSPLKMHARALAHARARAHLGALESHSRGLTLTSARSHFPDSRRRHEV